VLQLHRALLQAERHAVQVGQQRADLAHLAPTRAAHRWFFLMSPSESPMRRPKKAMARYCEAVFLVFLVVMVSGVFLRGVSRLGEKTMRPIVSHVNRFATPRCRFFATALRAAISRRHKRERPRRR
jgi:hypothetical protein